MGFSADNACHIQGQAAMIISSYQRFCPVTYEAVRSAGLGQRLLEIATWRHGNDGGRGNSLQFELVHVVS